MNNINFYLFLEFVKMAADVATKGFEKASEKSVSGKNKDVYDTAKVAAEAFKEKVDDDKWV